MVLHRPTRGGVARADMELAGDRGTLSVDGARTDDELLADLSIGEALGKETQHLALAYGQVGRRG